ncbi:MAG: 3-dehydroquinate synthase family protein, partial [Gemmatimonadota bacterium]
IPVIQVPTSLLAMVDASVGGKTGVDTPAGKNLVGAFHWPSLVLADPLVLQTLGQAHWRGGFAEMIKHGAVADAAHMDRVAQVASSAPNVDMGALTKLVAESITLKVRIVASDERESARRRALNAGHTLAHAIEHVSNYRIAHGDAVAIGLVLESALGERVGVTKEGTRRAIRDALARAGLPITLPDSLDPDAILAATRSDKKARDGHVEYSLVAALGTIDEAGGRFSRRVPDADVLAVLRAAQPTAA